VIPWSRRSTPASPSASQDSVCPDGDSKCDDSFTCCPVNGGGWGCCPLSSVTTLFGVVWFRMINLFRAVHSAAAADECSPDSGYTFLERACSLKFDYKLFSLLIICYFILVCVSVIEVFKHDSMSIKKITKA
jgi:hypothetical protein